MFQITRDKFGEMPWPNRSGDAGILLQLALLLVCFSKSSVYGRDESPSLADALEAKQFQQARQLLADGAAVNAAQPDGMTALHWSVLHSNLDTTKQLLDANANANAATRYGVVPLLIACQNGDAEIVQLLLNADADPNSKLRSGESALMTAARSGSLKSVELLLKAGADVNSKDKRKQTAAMWAAAEGHASVVATLIDAKADYQTPLPSGFTPMFFAVREGRIEVVRELLRRGIKVNDVMQPKQGGGKRPARGTSPLLLAVENGHFELASVLLEAGADPNDARLGYTALHAITWVRKPLRGDGNPSPVGSGRVSSLELVERLITRYRADVNARHKKVRPRGGRLNWSGATPFFLACQTSDVPLIRLLLKHKADHKIGNADGSTCLMAAAGLGDLGSGDLPAGTDEEALATVKLLLDLGANPNIIDKNKETAMHGAAYANRPDVVRLLAKHGAKPSVWNTRNKNGWTPMKIAQGYRHGNFRPDPATIKAINEISRVPAAQ